MRHPLKAHQEAEEELVPEEAQSTQQEVANVVNHLEVREDLIDGFDQDSSVPQQWHHEQELVDELEVGGSIDIRYVSNYSHNKQSHTIFLWFHNKHFVPLPNIFAQHTSFFLVSKI